MQCLRSTFFWSQKWRNRFGILRTQIGNGDDLNWSENTASKMQYKKSKKKNPGFAFLPTNCEKCNNKSFCILWMIQHYLDGNEGIGQGYSVWFIDGSYRSQSSLTGARLRPDGITFCYLFSFCFLIIYI